MLGAVRSYTIEMEPEILPINMLKNQLEMVKYEANYNPSLLEKLIDIATHKHKFIHTKEQVQVAELEIYTRLVLVKFNDVN